MCGLYSKVDNMLLSGNLDSCRQFMTHHCHYVSHCQILQYRRMMRKALADKYHDKTSNREKNDERRAQLGPTYQKHVTDDVFVTIDSSNQD